MSSLAELLELTVGIGGEVAAAEPPREETIDVGVSKEECKILWRGSLGLSKWVKKIIGS